MITLEDCIALCGLKEEEVRAIAEHETSPTSEPLRSVIRAAATRGDDDRAGELIMILRHFLSEDPETGSADDALRLSVPAKRRSHLTSSAETPKATVGNKDAHPALWPAEISTRFRG